MRVKLPIFIPIFLVKIKFLNVRADGNSVTRLGKISSFGKSTDLNKDKTLMPFKNSYEKD
jgi:hypothetical protein